MMASRPNKRQEAKQRNRLLKDLFLLIQWLDCEDVMFDTIPARNVTPPEGVDILDVKPADHCQASHENRYYRVKVLATGKYVDMKKEQAIKEKEAQRVETDGTVYPCDNEATTTDKTNCSMTSLSMTSPSVISLSATRPSVTSPSMTSPSVTSPSMTSPSVTSPSVTSPSMTSPSVTSPSVTSPSFTSPSVTTPSNIDREIPTVGKKRTPRKKQGTPKKSTPKRTTKKDMRPLSKKAKLCLSDDGSSSDSLSESEETPQKQSLETKRAVNISRNELFKQMIGLSPSLPSTTMTTEVTILKEKIRVLEKSHSSLKRRVSEQATELNRLARMTSTEMSSASASEVTPDPGYFAVPHGRPRSKEQSPQMSPLLYKGKIDDTPDFLHGVDKLKLANAKLQSDPGNAALKLMDAIFTVEEMVNCNPSGVTKSKDPTRKRTIQTLDAAKMKFINDILQEKWGVNIMDKSVRKRMTQKCTDYYHNKRYIHLRLK